MTDGKDPGQNSDGTLTLKRLRCLSKDVPLGEGKA